MDHTIGPPEGSCRQAPDVGGVPDGGRGAEDGGELGEQEEPVEEVSQSKRRTQRGSSWCAGTRSAFLDVDAAAS